MADSDFGRRKTAEELQSARMDRVLEDRSNKLRELSAALESALASQLAVKPLLPASHRSPSPRPSDSAAALAGPKPAERDENSPAFARKADSHNSSSTMVSTPNRKPSPQRPQSPKFVIDPALYPKLPPGLVGLPPSFSPTITAKARQMPSKQPFHLRLSRPPPDKETAPGPNSARGSANRPQGTPSRSRSAEAGSRPRTRRTSAERSVTALYKEAAERRERADLRRSLAEEQAEAERNVRKVNKVSEDLIRKRRDKELQQVWEAFVARQLGDEPPLDLELQTINYQQLHDLLGELGFFNPLGAGPLQKEQEEKLTDKIWCAMNTAGMPFVQFRDFLRVMSNVLQPPTPRKAPRSRTPSKAKPNLTTETAATPLAWEPTPIHWDNEDAAETVRAVAAALNLTNAATFAYTPVPDTNQKGTLARSHSQEAAAKARSSPPRQSSRKSASVLDGLPVKVDWHRELSFHKLHKTPIGHVPKVPYVDPDAEECTFQPTINEYSRWLGEQSEEQLLEQQAGSGTAPAKVPRELAMSERDKQAKKRLEELRHEKELKEVEGCTFKPTITPYQRPIQKPLQQVTKVVISPRLEGTATRGRPDGPLETTEEKEFHQFCTFKPVLRAHDAPRKLVKSEAPIVGYDDHLKRLNQAKQLKLQQQVLEENLRMGRPIHVDPAKYAEPDKQTVPKPFNFHLDQRKRAKPLLYMDISIGPGKTGRLGIHENDDPVVLATNFASLYQLDEALRLKLQHMLQKQMDVLAKKSTQGEGTAQKRRTKRTKKGAGDAPLSDVESTPQPAIPASGGQFLDDTEGATFRKSELEEAAETSLLIFSQSTDSQSP